MEKRDISKWLNDLDKVLAEQLNTFNKYKNEHPYDIEWNNFFDNRIKEFNEEIEAEKKRIKKQYSIIEEN